MNPYIIGPYTEDDTSRFWGRTQEIEGMYKSFLQNDYLVCYANSGEGKSSILNAGLFPKLRNSKYCPINIRFKFDENEYSDYNFDRIISDIIEKSLKNVAGFEKFEVTYFYDSGCGDESNLLWQRNLIRSSLWLRLRFSELLIKNKDTNETSIYTPVLVFDQFEEVFTNPRSEIWTKEFFKWLEELSTDVCPERIVKLIDEHDGDIDISMVPSTKRFKAIFSLRSEYVGNVDYWGLQHFYIPDLKNNRYFLKPLKPNGAVEVIKQPEGFPQMPDKICENIVLGCGENEELVREQLPCIPASILSIICHELYNLNENERNKIADLLVKGRNSIVEKILENYYLRTLSECGIKDDKTRDAFEKALVDDKGNRKRIGVKHKDLQPLSDNQIEKLTGANMLRVVSKAKNDNDIEGDIVELPHDRFCKFITNHKNKRFEEIQAKNRSLKEWLLFGITCLVLGICSWRIHSVFIDKMKPVIDMYLREQITESDILKNVFNIISPFSQNNNLLESYASAWCVVLYAIALPCLFLYLAKKQKITALIISIIAVLLSTLIMYKIGSFVDGQIGSLSFISLLISFGIISYLLIKWKTIGTSDVRSWPLWGSWVLFFFYLFCEFVFGLKIGVGVPCDSWYFVILIPILVFLWSWSFFRIKPWDSNNRYVNITFFYVAAIVAIVILYVVADNNSHSYLIGNKLPKYLVYILLSILCIIQLCLLWNTPSRTKRIIAFAVNSILMVGVFSLNLGCNFLKIDYDCVAHVANWRSVYIKDASADKYGICNPINGKEVFPIIISRNNVGRFEFEVTSQSLSSYSDSCNSDSSFYRNAGITHAKFFTSPTLEEYIFKTKEINLKGLPLDSKIDFYAVQLFEELRNANIAFLTEGKSYSINKLATWEILDSLQQKALERDLAVLNINTQDTIWQFDRPIPRAKSDVIEDDDIHIFYKSLARSFFLCSLRDRVTHNDIPSVFTLQRLFPLLFFTSVPLMDYTYNSTTNINVQDYSQSSKVTICSQDILEQKAFAWYNLFNSLCTFDISLNALTYVEAKEKTNLISFLSDFLKELEDINKALEKTNSDIESSTSSLKDDSITGLSTAISKLFTAMKNVNNNKTRLNEMKNRRKMELEETSFAIETVKADGAFINMQEKVFNTLLPIMNRNTSGMYNNMFEMTCKNLMIVQIMRLYDVKKDLEKVSQYDSLRNQWYNEIKKLNDSNPSELTTLKDKVIEQLDIIK